MFPRQTYPIWNGSIVAQFVKIGNIVFRERMDFYILYKITRPFLLTDAHLSGRKEPLNLGFVENLPIIATPVSYKKPPPVEKVSVRSGRKADGSNGRMRDGGRTGGGLLLIEKRTKKIECHPDQAKRVEG